MRILIVDDDPDIQDFLKTRLEEKCFACDIAKDGKEALYFAKVNEYDLIILDYSLPSKTGYEVCELLRKEGNFVPIIIVSGTFEIPHKVRGFMLGVDDYVIKPFYFDELYARIQAVLRRPKIQMKTELELDTLVVDTIKQTVYRDGTPIHLTRKEFSLLEYLMRNKGAVVSRGSILEHIWDGSVDPFSNTVETHIMNLRKKVDMPPHKKLIHSISGRGYKIDLF
jgi:DNA-binding response OmpR family regulator